MNDTEAVQWVATQIGLRADRPQARKRGDQAWMREIATWLEGHANNLAAGNGSYAACNSVSDTEDAIRIARAYLGEEAAI